MESMENRAWYITGTGTQEILTIVMGCQDLGLSQHLAGLLKKMIQRWLRFGMVSQCCWLCAVPRSAFISHSCHRGIKATTFFRSWNSHCGLA